MLEILVDRNLISLLWELAFSSNPNAKGDEFINLLMDKFTAVLSSFLNKQGIYVNKEVITKSITLINNVRARNFKVI